MIQKKKLAPLLILSLLIFLIACSPSTTYRFLYSFDEIAEISIVTLSFDENMELIQTELQKIEDTKLFLKNLKSIRCYKRFGDPTGATEEGIENIVFKVLYKNDDYELIDWGGQSVYTSEKGLKFYAGYCGFDKEEFEALLLEYQLIPHKTGDGSVIDHV